MPAGWDELQHPIPTGLVDVASGPAGLVAIGNSYGDDGMVPVVLHSTDGREWSAVSLPADSVSPLLSAVVPYDGGFVLVGAVDAGPRGESATPAAWYSSDGVSWSRATVNVDSRLFPTGIVGIGEMGDVTAGSNGLVGWWGLRGMTAGGPRYMVMWTSSDGRTWQPRDHNTARPGLAHGYVAGDGVRMVASARLRTRPPIQPSGRASARRGPRPTESRGPRSACRASSTTSWRACGSCPMA